MARIAAYWPKIHPRPSSTSTRSVRAARPPGGHGVVAGFAGEPAPSGSVKRLSKFDRFAISASVQVGKHHAGAGNCLAWGGNGGICAGRAGAGGKAADVVAQPASHAVKLSAASAQACLARVAGVGDAGDSQEVLLFFGALPALGSQCGGGRVSNLLSMLGFQG